MNIRPAEIADLKKLAKLFDHYRQFYRKSSDLDAATKFLSERLENGDSEIFVAEKDDKVLVGFVQLYPLFSSTRMKKMWLLNDLYVDPKARGQHVSVQLIERAKQLAHDSNACGMYLETEKTNKIGNNLYPKTGFDLYDSVNFYEWNT
ncbi:MAG: GNAT family N-acetyltransferase [Flavobacteriales bacterium]|nr:GNAT family N-acetyltransferase [Flavobacteriales bacterium]